MSRRRVNPFKASAKTKRQYKAFTNATVGSTMKAAGKAHAVMVKGRKAHQAQVRANMRGTFLGRMPVLAFLVGLWTGHGCITKLVLIPFFIFYLAWLPFDFLIALIATPFAK